MIQKCPSVFALGLILFVLTPRASGGNLITNGSFETGDFAGWNFTGDSAKSQVVSGQFYLYPGAEDGRFYAVLGTTPGQGEGAIYTSYLNANSTTPVNIDFWLNGVGDPSSGIEAYFNGTLLTYRDNLNTSGKWTELSFVAPQQSGYNTLEFIFLDDTGYIALDNVSIEAIRGTTPEPSGLLLLGSGLLTVGGAFRKLNRWQIKRKKPSGKPTPEISLRKQKSHT